MTTDILYVTCQRDYRWFEASIKLLQKYLTGYRFIHVVTSIEDLVHFERFGSDKIRLHYVPMWPGRGYFWQQYCKLKAPLFSTADFIMHIDSDVFVLAETDTLKFFAPNGNPYWARTLYSELPPEIPWRQPTEQALAVNVEHEYMRCFPFVVPRHLYSLTEKMIVANHRVSLEDYIRKAQVFSEFNVLGAVANYAYKNRVEIVSPDQLPKEFQNVKQFWSHGEFPHELIKSLL